MTHPSQNKWKSLEELMDSLNINKDDIQEKSILGSGKGGQKQNKTANCIFVKHIPTNIEVKCQKSRSKELNRFLALRRLCEKIQEYKGIPTKKETLYNKIRKQKKRRHRRNKSKDS